MSGGGAGAVGGGGIAFSPTGGGGGGTGHRRIASIRSNARNLFKSNKSSHSDLSSRARSIEHQNGSGNISPSSGNNKAAIPHIMGVNQIVSPTHTEPPILEEGPATHVTGRNGNGYISPPPPPQSASGSRISPPPPSSGSQQTLHQQNSRNIYGNNSLYHSHSSSAFEVGQVGTSIHSRSTHRRPSQVSETVFGEPISMAHHFGHHHHRGGAGAGDSGSVRSKTSDIDAVMSGSERDGASPTSPTGSGAGVHKQKKHGSGNKIRMALGLLRRRSGSNLKRQQNSVEPIGEERETVEWQPQFRVRVFLPVPRVWDMCSPSRLSSAGTAP